MLVHTVFFWMKKNAPKSAAKQTMKDALKYLKTPTVKHLWAGLPAKTEARDVINATYDVGLTVTFDSVADHDAYQEDPEHLSWYQKPTQLAGVALVIVIVLNILFW